MQQELQWRTNWTNKISLLLLREEEKSRGWYYPQPIADPPYTQPILNNPNHPHDIKKRKTSFTRIISYNIGVTRQWNSKQGRNITKNQSKRKDNSEETKDQQYNQSHAAISAKKNSLLFRIKLSSRQLLMFPIANWNVDATWWILSLTWASEFRVNRSECCYNNLYKADIIIPLCTMK